MNSFRRLLPAILALWGAAFAAAAEPTTAAPPPTSIATIDIIRLFDKLDERSQWQINLTALNKRIQDELTSRSKAVEELKKAMESATGPALATARDKFTIAELQLQSWSRLKQAEIDREQALMWSSIYHNIRVESEKLAQADGYDLILVNDGVTELQLDPAARVPQAQQAQEQIMRRRVMYAAKGIDVTDKLLLRMNNANSTAKSGAGAPATTPGGATPPAGNTPPAGSTPPAGGGAAPAPSSPGTRPPSTNASSTTGGQP